MPSQRAEPGPDQPFRNIHFAEVFQNPPVPHVPENTLLFDANPLSIGIEYRHLSEDILAQVYEHLRFDDLDAKKHYHCLRSDGRHAVVWYDDIANGNLVTWAVSSLRDRAADMLELAGAGNLAARVDRDALARVLPEAEAAARAQAVQPAA